MIAGRLQAAAGVVMKLPRSISLVLVLAVAACNSSTPRGGGAQTNTSTAPAPSTAPSPSGGAAGPPLSPNVPADMPPNPSQADAVTYAWQQFVALNWPALAGMRGVPDTSKMIGASGEVVWHTWKAPDEIFFADGRMPPSWNDYGGELPSQCAAAGAPSMGLVLTRTSKVPGNITNDAVELAKQAVGGTITDQHGNLARYEVRLNQMIFNAIVTSQFYNTQGQDAARQISFLPGVMEVKASWRQILPNEPPTVTSRYYTETAWIYTPQFGPNRPTCVMGTVGLVGLHITQKTQSRPQWTWATFEQIDNVPPTTPPYTGPLSFNDPTCPVAMCPPNMSTEKNGVPTGKPTQVTRVIPIGDEAAAANPMWQQALAAAAPNSPFRYYQLVDIQWPSNPSSQRPGGVPTPSLLANTTMETYVRQSSCINCHFTARTYSSKLSSDYSFMLAEAKPASASRTGGAR